MRNNLTASIASVLRLPSFPASCSEMLRRTLFEQGRDWKGSCGKTCVKYRSVFIASFGSNRINY